MSEAIHLTEAGWKFTRISYSDRFDDDQLAVSDNLPPTEHEPRDTQR